MLNAWENYGYEDAEAEFRTRYDTKHRPKKRREVSLEQVVKGKLEFIKQVRGANDPRLGKLVCRLQRLQGEFNIDTSKAPSEYDTDVFICHASEDKEEFVHPLKNALQHAGMTVWEDVDKIGWGASLIEEIEKGLMTSRFAIVVLSEVFLTKKWTVREMRALLNMEIDSGILRVLLLMADPSDEFASRVRKKYPFIADKKYEVWNPGDLKKLVRALQDRLGTIPE